MSIDIRWNWSTTRKISRPFYSDQHTRFFVFFFFCLLLLLLLVSRLFASPLCPVDPSAHQKFAPSSIGISRPPIYILICIHIKRSSAFQCACRSVCACMSIGHRARVWSLRESRFQKGHGPSPWTLRRSYVPPSIHIIHVNPAELNRSEI